MTQHRTREEQMRELTEDFQGMADRSWARRGSCPAGHIDEAEARATSELRAENERLREALAQIAGHVGGFASPDATTDFLCLIPEEVRLKVAALSCTPAVGCTDRERLDWVLNMGLFHESFDRDAIDAAMDKESQ